MYDLWFDDPIFQPVWSESVPAMNGVVRSAIYRPGSGDGPAVVDEVTLALDGTETDIEHYLRALEGVLRMCETGQVEALPGGVQAQRALQAHLLYRAAPGAPIWRSLLLGGRLEHGTGGLDPRQHGGQMVRLILRRLNYWEERAARPNPLASESGTSGTLGGWVQISNHDDGHPGHSNACWDDLTTPDVQPVTEISPYTLAMQRVDANGARPLTIYAGQRCRYGAQPVAMQIQGQAGAARAGGMGAPVNNSQCSGGQYLNLTWTGSDETELWQADLLDAQGLLGLPYRLMARLASGLPAQAQVWCRWRVYAVDAAGEHLLSQSEGRYLETRSECLEGPVMDLPPWPVTEERGSLRLRLVLVARTAGAGPHALPLDFLMLLPLEGWRTYRPLDRQPTLELLDEGTSGALNSAAGLRTHSLEGPGLARRWSTGSAAFWFVLVQHEPDGSRRWPIELGLRVKLEYRARKRLL